jgi:hypothetical protein
MLRMQEGKEKKLNDLSHVKMDCAAPASFTQSKHEFVRR